MQGRGGFISFIFSKLEEATACMKWRHGVEVQG